MDASQLTGYLRESFATVFISGDPTEKPSKTPDPYSSHFPMSEGVNCHLIITIIDFDGADWIQH